ncbi:MAG: bifunctional protein-serine/threonine kinase/phosphatase [Beijerinckiaceae bacterium]|nr:bifunctional protein-serine/threonine kinase/phosphatase [Beijerinckiaceae bacterium]
MTSRTEPGRLEVRFGICTDQGRRPQNEDYAGIYAGTAEEQARAGIIAAIADGVGGSKGGRVAAELAVRGFIDGYLTQGGTCGVHQAGAQSLEAVNRWTHSIGRKDDALQDMATTFTALVLRGRQAHILHIGDTRLYRLRDGRLNLLTEDHTLSGADRSHILTRAIGPAPAIQIDYSMEEMRVHDRFLLCSDGVHGVLPERSINEELSRRTGPEDSAAQLVNAALAARSSDNVTAIIIDIVDLPAANLTDLGLSAAALPIIPPPETGARVDGFLLGAILADGRYSRVFRALDEAAKQAVIVKFPKPSVAEDEVLRQAFLRESWIATRVRSPWVGECIELPPGRQNCLYSVLPFYEGETLEQRLARPPPIRLALGLDIAIKLAKGVAALHRAGIIHRDIKPENIILLLNGGLKLIDLGVARLPHLEDAPMAVEPGTPSYKAPELISGTGSGERTDQFALGVTIYRMFTRAYPYGEVEPFSRPRFAKPAPLTKHRPDLPAWLDHALARTFAVRPEDRFDDVLEFIFDLEHGEDRARPQETPRLPLYDRNPLRFWQAISAILAVLLVAALALLAKGKAG